MAMNDAGYPLLTDKSLAVFFSMGVSLETWHQSGTMERDSAAYNRMAGVFRSIYFFTYGSQGEHAYVGSLMANVQVVPKSLGLPPVPFAMTLALSQRAFLRNVDLLKTLQISGAWAALPAKLLWHKPLIVRCGFQQSLFYRRKVAANRGRLRTIFSGLYIAYTFLELAAYHAADLVLVTSEFDRQHVLSRYRVSPSKVKVLPNGIEVDRFRPEPETKRNPRQICFVGRLVRQKNLFALLDAVKGLDVELVVVGDGLLREALEQHAKTQCVRNVEFRGRVVNSALPSVLNSSAVFLLVSHYEGNPKALLEAMSCGLPVIGSDVDGIRQVIKHRENGYLCPPTAEGIRDALQDVLGDVPLMEKMGLHARRTIVDRYSLDALVAEELELMQDLLK